jgi:hypothetical protein
VEQIEGVSGGFHSFSSGQARMGHVPGHLAATILRSSADDWPRVHEKRAEDIALPVSMGRAAELQRVRFGPGEFRLFSVEWGKNFQPDPKKDQMETNIAEK